MRAGRRHRVAHALGAVTALTGSNAFLQMKRTSPSVSMSNTTTRWVSCPLVSKRMVGHGWVPMTTEIAAVWPQVVPKLVKGQMRVYADATWGW